MAVRRVIPIVTVPDMRAAVAAYSQALGLEVVMDHGWIATLAAPDRTNQLSLLDRDPTGPENPALSVEVDELAVAESETRAAGLEIIYGPVDEEWGVRRFFFRDAAGTVVNVLTHR